MVRTISDYYSIIFQEEEGITVAKFDTKSGTGYRAYFYPLCDFYDQAEKGTFLHKDGYHFGFTKIAPNENKNENIDIRISNTIIQIVKEFFETMGKEKILTYYCDNEDGKKNRRAQSFSEQFEHANSNNRFKKKDEELHVPKDDGSFEIEHLGLIMEIGNPDEEEILKEFQSIKEGLVANKI